MKGPKSFTEAVVEGGRDRQESRNGKEGKIRKISWHTNKEESRWVEFSVEFISSRFLWGDVMDRCKASGNCLVSAFTTRWFCLSGFPVRMWCPSFLKVIGNSFGSTVHVEKMRSLSGRMDCC
ncbi:hypothetical protein LWI28_020966 [Acer negundo]|uniref:DUF4283 domain-containing protein n=1 Tax=Acer negundo TaxID=4023 RepID=A0AAD5I6X5_ACENE|nr:hypothetical protein LWI28_020966 [Acer negundo]